MKPDWYSTIHSLRLLAHRDAQAALKCQQLIKNWMTLGEVLGLQEQQEKLEYVERQEAARLCAWKDCEYHKTKPPTSTKACMGCGEVVSADWSLKTRSSR